MRKTFAGRLWSQHEQNANRFDKADDITIVESIPDAGLDDERLCRGMNSGYQAVNLAYIFGARVVLLLGYVMAGRGTHFFGHHPQPINMQTNYETFQKPFENMNPELYGLEVVNCSVNTALRCFPTMSLDNALEIYRPRG